MKKLVAYPLDLTAKTSRAAMGKLAGQAGYVAMFPSVWAIDSYRAEGDSLWRSRAPGVQSLYREAAVALNIRDEKGDPNPQALWFSPENIPDYSDRQNGKIYVLFLLHNLCLDQLYREQKKSDITAYSGISLGMLTASIASGALSLRDGLLLANFLLPCSNRFYENEFHTPYTGLVVQTKHPEQLTHEIEEYFDSTYEAHTRQDRVVPDKVDIRVPSDRYEDFLQWLSSRYSESQVIQCKHGLVIQAHSRMLQPVVPLIERFIQEHNIQFQDPHTPIIANHEKSLLLTAQDVKTAIMAIITDPVHAIGTFDMIRELSPLGVIEFGLGGTSRLFADSDSFDLPFLPFTGPH